MTESEEARLARLEERIKTVESDLTRIRDDQRRIFEKLEALANIAAMGRGGLAASLRWGGVIAGAVGLGAWAGAKMKGLG